MFKMRPRCLDWVSFTLLQLQKCQSVCGWSDAVVGTFSGLRNCANEKVLFFVIVTKAREKPESLAGARERREMASVEKLSLGLIWVVTWLH